MKPITSLLIRVAVSFSLMALLIYTMRDSFSPMFAALRQIPYFVFPSGVLMFTLSTFIISFRLQTLLKVQRIFLNAIDIARLTFVGYFFSSFLPTSVGGDVVKAFYISKKSEKTMQSYTSVFIDRFLGLFTIILIATGALFFVKEISGFHIKWLLLVLLIGSLVFMVLLVNKEWAKKFSFMTRFLIFPKVKEKSRDIYNAMHIYKEHKKDIFKCAVISIAAQVISFSAIYIFALGLNSHIPLRLVLLAVPVASIASMLPSINGIGVREMSLVIILRPFVGADKALTIAFLWLCTLLLIALIGGIIYIFMDHYKFREVNYAG